MSGLIGRRARRIRLTADKEPMPEGEVVAIQTGEAYFRVLVLLDNGMLKQWLYDQVVVLPRDYQGPLR